VPERDFSSLGGTVTKMRWHLSATEVEQEAQLPQRNSASAAHVYLGWLTNPAMHRTPYAESQRLYYFLTFKRSDSRNAGRKTDFDMK